MFIPSTIVRHLEKFRSQESKFHTNLEKNTIRQFLKNCLSTSAGHIKSHFENLKNEDAKNK